MNKLRCNNIVFDLKSQKERLCKHKINKNTNILYCSLHYNIFIKKNILKIQSHYRGYVCRKKTNYFKHCPIEVVHKILFYYNQDFHYERYKNTISNIITNKLENFIKKRYLSHGQITYVHSIIETYNNRNLFNLYREADIICNEILYLFYLLDKYKIILDIDTNNFFLKKYKDYEHLHRMNCVTIYDKFKTLQIRLYPYITSININLFILLDNYKYLNSLLKF